MSLSGLNSKKQKRIRLATKRLLAAALASCPWLAACSDGPKLPQTPLSFPFDTQTVGFKVEADVRVVDHNSYEFGFKLDFKEGNVVDRERVKKLTGDAWRDKAGKLIQPGVPIAVRIRINALKPSALEGVFEREITEEALSAWGDSYFRTEIIKVRLKPGVYHFVIENLKTVPELRGTPLTLSVTTDPKSSTIAD